MYASEMFDVDSDVYDRRLIEIGKEMIQIRDYSAYKYEHRGKGDHPKAYYAASFHVADSVLTSMRIYFPWLFQTESTESTESTD